VLAGRREARVPTGPEVTLVAGVPAPSRAGRLEHGDKRLQSAAVSGDRTKLEVRERDERGSRRSRRLRAQGMIPGVLYGNGGSRAITVSERALRAVMSGPSGVHAILDVVLEGQETVHPSVLADHQQDPVRGNLLHIDLREVRLDQTIHASVVVHLVGESPGVKTGGVLSLVTREIRVEALPTDVPEHIDADLTGMEVGDVLRLEDLPAIEDVTFLDDPHETVIATVSAPRGLVELEAEEEAEAEAEEGAEVEGAEGEEAVAEGDEQPAGEAPAE
jgi:large subunit ribosomal protein L25